MAKLRKHRCPYCGSGSKRTEAAIKENPFCAGCLHERIAASVAERGPMPAPNPPPLSDLDFAEAIRALCQCKTEGEVVAAVAHGVKRGFMSADDGHRLEQAVFDRMSPRVVARVFAPLPPLTPKQVEYIDRESSRCKEESEAATRGMERLRTVCRISSDTTPTGTKTGITSGKTRSDR